DEHAGAPELSAVRVQQPRRPVETDGRLPRARSALHYEDTLRLARDQRVLVCLDGRDDVAHVLVAAALELLEEDVRDAVHDVSGRSVERLVVEVEERSPLDAEAPPESDALRLGDGRGV